MRPGLDIGLPTVRDVRVDFPAADDTPRGFNSGSYEKWYECKKHGRSLVATGIENDSRRLRR